MQGARSLQLCLCRSALLIQYCIRGFAQLALPTGPFSGADITFLWTGWRHNYDNYG